MTSFKAALRKKYELRFIKKYNSYIILVRKLDSKEPLKYAILFYIYHASNFDIYYNEVYYEIRCMQ